MSKQLSEQKVLKQLGIPDFRHLTKAKVIELTSMLDRMDPEVAKKALEQFPEFAKTSKEILKEYKDLMERGMQSNDDSMKAVYLEYHTVNEALLKLLDEEVLTFEQRKYVIEQMKEIADKVDKKDSENKKWITKMAIIAASTILGAVAVLATTLGENTYVKDIDSSDDDNNGES